MKSQPLYMNIYDDILFKIKKGSFSENSPLPSERELILNYNVSRSTVRKALNILQMNGFIYKIHGQGTFIKPQVFEQPLYNFYSFTDELKKDNITIRNSILSYEQFQLDSSLSSKLNKSKGEVFHKIVRLRSAKNYPLMIEITYLPKNRFFNINTDILEEKSLYSYLFSKYSLSVDKATETFRPIIPNSQECSLLKITSKIPCILLERFSYEENELVEYTQSIVRGDKYVFKVNLSTY